MANFITLKPGYHYYAGVSIPWYLPRSTVTSKLIDYNFVNINWHKREEQLPSNKNPKNYKKYDDDWDEWVDAYWAGDAKKRIEAPAKPAWILAVKGKKSRKELVAKREIVKKILKEKSSNLFTEYKIPIIVGTAGIIGIILYKLSRRS